MMFTIEFFRIRKEENARAMLDRITHIASDLESAKVKAKSLFETLNMPQNTPMACEFWTRMGKRCSFGHRGRRVPRDPDGEDRVPSLIVCEAFFRAISAFIFHGWLRISWQEGLVRVRSIAVRADGLRCANHLSKHLSRVRRSLWRRVRCAATEKRKSRSRTRIRRNAVRHPHRSPSNSAPRT